MRLTRKVRDLKPGECMTDISADVERIARRLAQEQAESLKEQGYDPIMVSVDLKLYATVCVPEDQAREKTKGRKG